MPPVGEKSVPGAKMSLALMHRLSAIGTPEHCAERLATLVAAGATSFSLYLLSDRPYEQAALLTEHLLPLLPSLLPTPS